MKIIRFLLISTICVSSITAANAQSFFSFSTGISTDINRNRKSFYQIPVSVQWKPESSTRLPLIFEFDYGIPLITTGSGEAYTLNPQLPEKVTLTESIRASIFTISVGFQINLLNNEKKGRLCLDLFPLALSSQHYKINYKNYDKENYEVLNPDLNRNTGGLAMAMALIYNFHKNQDMMAMIRIQSPTFTKKADYPLSYNCIAPLQFTIGYNFYYKK
jgi:hypothetical protein